VTAGNGGGRREPTCTVPAGLGVVLGELGISAAAAVRRAGLPVDLLATPRPRLRVEEYFGLWDAIAATAGDPLTGIRLGARYPPHTLEPVFLACLGSRTLGDGLARIARYKSTLTPEVLTIRHAGQRVELTYDWPGARPEPPPVLVEAELSFLLYLARRATGRPMRHARLGLTRPTGDAAPYTRELNADVRLGCPVGTLNLAASDLTLPLATYNTALLTALDPALDLAQPATPVTEDPIAAVRHVLRRRIGDSDISLPKVAVDLGISPRTLQRQLGDRGASFAAVLREVRLDRARFYLRSTTLSMSEIAFLLGYDTPASFYRAFARWTGQTPGDFRAGPVP
jgi:AraC-like DNA-binding protein